MGIQRQLRVTPLPGTADIGLLLKEDGRNPMLSQNVCGCQACQPRADNHHIMDICCQNTLLSNAFRSLGTVRGGDKMAMSIAVT
ncbi:hypothetical protein [Rhizobium sp. NFR03]|uniref:hypothetical protein n=1 Tax=Rhizobium sp. NFR03 TaxID=1566263 RepID=UPI0008C9C027|nr:hypothetical protein [Rhizobium sp. NFR03]SES25536.1 hypothetical protein SAMN03159406_03012 [Rhizobium sp. NFR03]